VYILDRRSEAAYSGDKFVVQLHDFPDPLTAEVLIAAQDQLPVSLQPSPAHELPLSSIARCIVVTDKPIPFPPVLSSQEGLSEGKVESSSATSGGEGAGGQEPESATPSEGPVEATPIDTSVIIFPPNSVNGGSSTEAAQALVTGVGTLSAPQGKCMYT
jgi:Rab proteins geranylgeranyltransferase component A